MRALDLIGALGMFCLILAGVIAGTLLHDYAQGTYLFAAAIACRVVFAPESAR